VIFNSLKPDDELQPALAHRAAGLMWRLMRAQRLERESIADNLRTVPHDMRLSAGVTGRTIPSPAPPNTSTRPTQWQCNA
jgi:hypothetical protein